jgi:hypothetical protein
MVAYPLPAPVVLAAPVTLTGATTKSTVLTGTSIPAGTLAAGQVWEITAHGSLTTLASTDKYTIELDLDGASAFSWGAQQPNSGGTITGGEWNIWMKVIFASATSYSVWGWNGFNYFYSAQTDTAALTASAAAHAFSLAMTPTNAAASITVTGACIQRTA